MIDPKTHRCTCGNIWKPRLHHKILMLIFGEYKRTCPQCQARMKFRLIGHVVKTESKTMLNESIWRKC